MKRIYLLICVTLFCTHAFGSELLTETEKTELAQQIKSNMGWFPFMSYGKQNIETIKKSLSTYDGKQFLQRCMNWRLDFAMAAVTYKEQRNKNSETTPQEIILGYEMSLHTLSRHFQEFIVFVLVSSALLYTNVPTVKNAVHRLLNIE